MPVVPFLYYRLPDFRITINGAPLAAFIEANIAAVSVDENPRWPSMFAFTLEPGDERAVVPWFDNHKLFAIGETVAVALGHDEQIDNLIEGEITALEPEFDSRSRPRLVVRGFDRGHRLLRGRTTRSFANQKDSDVARSIAEAAGMRTRIDDSGVAHEFLMQVQRSDWEFLAERARAIGFELRVDGRTLVFVPRRVDAAPVAILELGKQLLEFRPRLSTATQLTEVIAKGRDVEAHAQRRSSATAAPVQTGRGEHAATRVVKRAFGAAVETIVVPPAGNNDAELRQLAQARLDDAALGFVEGQAICAGDPGLRAGACVEVKGIGSRFGGNYYIAATRHRYDGDGYVSELHLQRSCA